MMHPVARLIAWGMTCTFWHCGVHIGDADLEQNPDRPLQRAGIFRPTPYGVEIFPRLTGILSAGHALKEYLDANGLDPDEMERAQIEEVLDTTPAGRKVIDIGRTLCDVELRASDGARLEIASIAFTDLLELQTLARELETERADDLSDLPPDAPRYVVSATLRDHSEPSIDERVNARLSSWQSDN